MKEIELSDVFQVLQSALLKKVRQGSRKLAVEAQVEADAPMSDPVTTDVLSSDLNGRVGGVPVGQHEGDMAESSDVVEIEAVDDGGVKPKAADDGLDDLLADDVDPAASKKESTAKSSKPAGAKASSAKASPAKASAGKASSAKASAAKASAAKPSKNFRVIKSNDKKPKTRKKIVKTFSSINLTDVFPGLVAHLTTPPVPKPPSTVSASEQDDPAIAAAVSLLLLHEFPPTLCGAFGTVVTIGLQPDELDQVLTASRAAPDRPSDNSCREHVHLANMRFPL